MKRVVRAVVVNAVGTSLFLTGWVLIGAFALGDRLKEPIPRTPTRDDYV